MSDRDPNKYKLFTCYFHDVRNEGAGICSEGRMWELNPDTALWDPCVQTGVLTSRPDDCAYFDLT